MDADTSVPAPRPDPLTLDVRPTIAAGGDPFDQIMTAAESLTPGQALVILNSFEPFPLYQRLGQRGFDHETGRLPNGDWKITFSRSAPG